MQRVGQRVGRHADQRRFDADERRVQVLAGDREAARGELACEHLRERRAARDVVLPQLALGLVDRHRRAAAEVRAVERRVDLALIQRVAVLVQRAEQRLDLAIAIARRHSAVARPDPRGERMGRDIDAPAGAIDADARKMPRRPLPGPRRGPPASARANAPARGRRAAAAPRRARRTDRADRRLQAEVVGAEQRVIGTLAALGQALAVGARELDVALQRRHEGGEVVGLARGLPALLTLRTGLRQLHRELGSAHAASAPSRGARCARCPRRARRAPGRRARTATRRRPARWRVRVSGGQACRAAGRARARPRRASSRADPTWRASPSPTDPTARPCGRAVFPVRSSR